MIRTAFLTTMLLALGAGASASASMADHAERSRIAGIDVITYHTAVRDVVDLVGYLPAGDAMAGSGNPAVPTLLGMMLDRGTQAQDQFTIARKLEEAGAEVSFGVGVQSMQFQAKCLARDLPLVLSILASELRTPALQPAELAKAKQQLIGMLENQRRNTEARAREALRRALYPAGHPNRPASIEEMLTGARSATVKDLQAFHDRFYGPAHLTLVLVGDVTMATAQGEIERNFAGWSGGQDFLRAAPGDYPKGGGVVSVDLPEKTSVSVLLGETTGLRYQDADSLALRVGTMIAGRGFTGRLMGSVRDKLGLTYDIGATVSDDSLVDGLWSVDASFAPKLLEPGLAATRATLETWWQGGVSEQELQDAKQGMIGGYYVGLATNQGLAIAIVTSLQRGYDLTRLDDFPRAVQALTREQVNAAIRKYVDLSRLTLVQAGTLPQGAH